MDFKIKALFEEDRLYLALLIVVVALASFGLGRLSVDAPLRASEPLAASAIPVPVPVPPPVSTPVVSQADGHSGGVAEAVVASKSGQRYHYPWCPGAGQIKEANRITFATPALAEAAGYTRAANCPQVR